MGNHTVLVVCFLLAGLYEISKTWGQRHFMGLFYQARGSKGAFRKEERHFLQLQNLGARAPNAPTPLLRLYLVFTYYNESACQIRPHAFVSAHFSVLVLSTLCGLENAKCGLET